MNIVLHETLMEKLPSFSPFRGAWCCLVGGLLLLLPLSNAFSHPGAAETLARLERENLHAPSPQRSAHIIDILVVQESCAAAVSFGESALQQFPNDLLVSTSLVRALICKKDLPRANRILAQALTTHGNSVDIDVLQLDLFEASGETTQAGVLAFKIVTLYETVEPDLFLRAANMSAVTDSSDERSATKILKRGISRHPAAVSLWLALLDHLQKRGEVCEAAQLTKKLRAQFPTLNKLEWEEREGALLRSCRQK